MSFTKKLNFREGVRQVLVGDLAVEQAAVAIGINTKEAANLIKNARILSVSKLFLTD